MNNNNNGEPIIVDDQYVESGSQWPAFNRTSFEFNHSLAGNALLGLEELRDAATAFVENGGPGRVSFFEGNKGPNANWADWNSEASRVERLQSCFDDIRAEGSTLIVIQDIEREPRYGALLNQVMSEIMQRIPGDLRNQVTWPSAYLFIAAPGFFTPYHMDHEVGLLLQIHGAKELYVYDGGNRAILSEEELEQYYVGNLDAATLKDEFVGSGRQFDLVPGTAAHFPAHAPHWVRNLEDYSISLSINFCLTSLDRAAPVYQANHFLRKFGIRPFPPGRSRIRDFTKRRLINAFSRWHPASKAEMLRSGVDRLYSIASAGRRSLRRTLTALHIA